MNSTRVSWLVVACCAEGWRRSCTSSHALQHCNAPWHQPLATSNSTDDANRSLRLTQHTTHTTRCSSMQHWHKTHHIHHARQRHAKTHGGVDPVAQGHVMQLAMQRECGHSRMHACTHARMHPSLTASLTHTYAHQLQYLNCRWCSVVGTLKTVHGTITRHLFCNTITGFKISVIF